MVRKIIMKGMFFKLVTVTNIINTTSKNNYSNRKLETPLGHSAVLDF